jgi:hypothetical protein
MVLWRGGRELLKAKRDIDRQTDRQTDRARIGIRSSTKVKQLKEACLGGVA